MPQPSGPSADGHPTEPLRPRFTSSIERRNALLPVWMLVPAAMVLTIVQNARPEGSNPLLGILGFIVVATSVIITTRVAVGRRLQEQIAAGGPTLQWQSADPAVLNGSLASITSLGFVPIGSYRYVSSDRSTALTELAPVFATPDNSSLLIAPGRTAIFISPLTDGRILMTTNCLVDHDSRHVLQCYVGTSADDLFARHQTGSNTLVSNGGPRPVQSVNIEETILKTGPRLAEDRDAQPPNPFTISAKKHKVFVDPLLVDPPATTSG